MGQEEDWMTTTEAMAVLGVSRITLYRWIKKGRLHAVKPRAAVEMQKWMLSRTEVMALLQPKAERQAGEG